MKNFFKFFLFILSLPFAPLGKLSFRIYALLNGLGYRRRSTFVQLDDGSLTTGVVFIIHSKKPLVPNGITNTEEPPCSDDSSNLPH